MAQSLAKLYTHLIFSTKNREPMISEDLVEELSAYMAGILRNIDCPPIRINAVNDHIHLLFCLGRNADIAGVVEEVKKSSSKWAKTKGAPRHFYWQSGYGAFSVSASSLDRVISYIANQREHHATVSFQDEFRRFLHKYEIEYDEKYVWD